MDAKKIQESLNLDAMLNDARSKAARDVLTKLSSELRTAEQLAAVLQHPLIAVLDLETVWRTLVANVSQRGNNDATVGQNAPIGTLLDKVNATDSKTNNVSLSDNKRPVGRPKGRAAEVDEIKAATDSRYYITKRSFWRNLPRGVSQRQTLAKLRELANQGVVDIKKGRGGWIRWSSSAAG